MWFVPRGLNIQAAGVLNGPINCMFAASPGVLLTSSSGETIIKTGYRCPGKFDQAYTLRKDHYENPKILYIIKSIEEKSQIVPLLQLVHSIL